MPWWCPAPCRQAAEERPARPVDRLRRHRQARRRAHPLQDQHQRAAAGLRTPRRSPVPLRRTEVAEGSPALEGPSRRHAAVHPSGGAVSAPRGAGSVKRSDFHLRRQSSGPRRVAAVWEFSRAPQRRTTCCLRDQLPDAACRRPEVAHGLDLVSVQLRGPHQPRQILAGGADHLVLDDVPRRADDHALVDLLGGPGPSIRLRHRRHLRAVRSRLLSLAVDGRSAASPDRRRSARCCSCGSIFATSIKRLHDRDKSGWWMLPFFALPGLYNQFADWLPDDSYLDLLLGLAASSSSASGALSNCIA